jgi:allantoinase
MTDDGTLLRGMRKVGELGGVVCVHAENDTLIQELVDRFRAEGRKDARAFIDSHPEYSELEAVHRLLFLAEQAPECAVHVCHMSVASGARLIREARGRGVTNVTCETCPQYLGLTEDDLVRVGAFAKCDPPVRSRETVDEMWGYVLDGTVDIVATDHSPHPAARKTGRADDFWTVAEGCTGLQIFGVADRKGRIEAGLDADFAIVDPDASWTLCAEDLFYLNPASPHTGETFKGRATETILRGQTVFRDGAILAPEGFGGFLPMRRG